MWCFRVKGYGCQMFSGMELYVKTVYVTHYG